MPGGLRSAALFLFVAWFFTTGSRLLSDLAPQPTVAFESGTLLGTHFSNAANEVAFLGIPYAAAPTGELRWKPPQAVRKWAGTRAATEYGSACVQLPAGWLPYLGGTEDCLYLNVWTTHLSNTAKLPVVVYFHGGSNRQGYSQLTPLGPAFSRMGVVVVTANYRLGPFGFLAHPLLTAESEHHSSGNYGLLDQLQALRWVHENISHFGGDPDRVTVMGQSAGAVDSCLLMASPLAKGLFHGAILQSGDCQSALSKDIRRPLHCNSITGTGELAGQQLAQALGIAANQDSLAKLRSIPAEQIMDAWKRDPKIQFDAIVDGWVVPEQPAKIFAGGTQMKIPVLVGSNSDEATVFGHGGPKTIEEYKTYLREDAGKYSDQEFQAYPVQTDGEVPARYLQLRSDSFAYGAYSMAKATARSGQKAFLYYFTFAENGKRAHLGAYHGEELYFLADSFPSDWEHNEDDQRLSGLMRQYWVQFAKTGGANLAGIPAWVSFNTYTNERFELGRKTGSLTIPSQVRSLENIMRQVLLETVDGGATADASQKP
jgi:para-nitrobenzyl esterase